VGSGTTVTKSAGESTPLTSLFSYSDLDNDIVAFAVKDREVGGGYLTKNGVQQTENALFDKVPIGEIGQWALVAGPAGSTSPVGFNAIDSRGVYSPGAFSTVSTGPVVIRDDASTIFAQYGTDATDGKVAFLATLALAAYHLDTNFEKTELDKYGATPGADPAYNDAVPKLQLLTATDLPSVAPHAVSNANFPITGLLNDGVYVDGNAAALVARSADALFISFRGTNDNGGGVSLLFDAGVVSLVAAVATGNLPAIQIAAAAIDAASSPDMDHWVDLNKFGYLVPDEGMADHYALLQPLIDAVDSYVNNPNNHISKVYVTGHSLGGAMTERFMSVPEHAGTKFEAITFGSPGNEDISNANDNRITNIRIEGDPVADQLRFGTLYADRGDIYEIQDQDRQLFW
jgi:hypothetical protein